MRQEWPVVLADIPVRNLVFIDESSANTCLAKQKGWGRKGERLRSFVPCGRWLTTTMICAIRHDRVCAPMLLDGPMDGFAFSAYVSQVLMPSLQTGDVVVMDNLSTHKTKEAESIFAQNGVRALYLPPYSPDLNPIENMWSKVKAYLRQKAARTLHGIMYAMTEAIESIAKEECSGYFNNAGYSC